MMLESDNTNDLVVLVHGIAGKRMVMYPLAYGLSRRGYRTSAWCYRSLWDSVPNHGATFNKYLCGLSKERRIHIVAHSMGCIVTRAALNMQRIENIGRVVFIAPPNRGSPVAKLAARMGQVIRPSKDLSNEDSSYVCRLSDQHDFEIGIIAARYDVVVPVSSTYLQSAREHVVLNGTHNSVLLSASVRAMTAHFLTHGTFSDKPDKVRH